MTEVVFPDCFACGRTYSRGDGRYCSSMCRAAYDDRFHRSAPTIHFKPKGDGFEIECRGCQKPFVSRGLRCCGPSCERKLAERQAITATLAEAGMDRAVKRKCVTCGSDIPRYVGTGKTRRAVPVSRVTYSKNARKSAGWPLVPKPMVSADKAA